MKERKNITMFILLVIGGIQGIYSKAGDYFIQNLREKINTVSLPRIKKEVQIEYSKFGKEIGVIGAVAYVVIEHLVNFNF